MKNKIKLTFFALCMIMMQASANISFKSDPIESVKQNLDMQVAAWNKGELENAMQFYWDSPEMLWINKGGISKGYTEVLNDYQKGYKDRSKMGTYSYEPLSIQQISSKAVLYVIRWKIMLDGKKQMGGVSTLIWMKKGSGWVITAEHAS